MKKLNNLNLQLEIIHSFIQQIVWVLTNTRCGARCRDTIINETHMVPWGMQGDRCQKTILLFIFVMQQITAC